MDADEQAAKIEWGAAGDWAATAHWYTGSEHPGHLGVSCMRYQEGARPVPERRAPTVAVDFDGVIHWYRNGWHDGTIYDEPVPGAIEGIKRLQQHYAVFVLTSRDPESVAAWLTLRGVPARTDGPPEEPERCPACRSATSESIPGGQGDRTEQCRDPWHAMPRREGRHPAFWSDQQVVLVTNRKLPAVAYVDDRAVPFTTWDYLVDVQMGWY